MVCGKEVNMDKKYTHIHLYVKEYDKCEQFLVLDFVERMVRVSSFAEGKEYQTICRNL
ncbi:hypothetical protein Sgly_0815 [Syntrophobotulus glycolicus DSM 8271]|uniref:Uncharacterized protein n=1 Tax=Syntrophobotulus glycolicus (strain DSM 8271 / FlGlyR) TaxID=645991 RepID=F0T1A4_SYNGF|nr:hypothetical protein Sgly_0815 [Syntrophobotulus glycolicus DSM 8271]